MDPNETLRRFRDAIKDRDLDEARAARADMARWVDGGGFLPSNYGSGWEVQRDMLRAIVQLKTLR